MPGEQTSKVRRVVTYAARLADQPRVLLAAKTSLAAVVSWYFAPFIPLAQDEYSYYAPLGAMVTMSPTIARSARVGIQVLAGLAAGIALSLCGVAALRFGVPGGVVLAVVVGVGVLLGGIRFLGAGQDWVAFAALFVLLAAGSDRGGFSVSYLVTMAFGVVVGIVVNLLVVPPLYLRRASARLSTLRDTVAALLEDAAGAIECGGIEDGRFDAAVATLRDTASGVTADVHEADESARANPRRARHRREKDENDRRLAALERTAFLTRDLVELLPEVDRLPDLRPVDGAAPAPARRALAEAIRRVAAVVATPLGDPAARARVAAAIDSLTAYADALGRTRTVGGPQSASATAVELGLYRIIDASRPSA